MGWNRKRINDVARSSASSDYTAFETIGLSEIEDAWVLDVGSFDGFNTVLKFAPYGNIAKIVGLEPSQEAFNWTQDATNDPRFVWLNTSLEEFESPNDTFDVTYLSHTFQHLPDKQIAAQKLFSLLKPGGFVVIKTVDDSTKISSPDPDGIMKQVLNFFEKEVHPHLTHVRHTDYYNGAKCYKLLKDVGFDPITVQISHANTLGKSEEERLDLFDRMTYFRRNVPDTAAPGTKKRMLDLLDQWEALFKQDNYYFDASTFMWIARKPKTGENNCCCSLEFRNGPFKDVQLDPSVWPNVEVNDFSIHPMTEDDLAGVMAIELQSFPSPWTPLAYIAELRHNKDAFYMVARNSAGIICGYVGWWYSTDSATIAHVAVDPSLRRKGLGKTLIEGACNTAQAAGKNAMLLQVRSANDTARAFYESLGFSNVGVSKNYYTNPDDDGIIMVRSLHP